MLQMNHVSAESFALPMIDLHFERSLERKATARASRRCIFAIAILLVAVPALFVPIMLQVLRTRAQYERTHRQLTSVQVRLASINQSNASLDPKVATWTRFKGSRDDRAAWRTAVTTLAAAVPGDVSFDQMQMTAQNKTVALAAQGSAINMQALKRLLNAMAASPAFTQVHLADTTNDEALGREGITFKLSGTVTGVLPGAAAAGS